jgi:hypothetical protein
VREDFDLRVGVENVIEFPGDSGYLSLGSWMLDQLPADATVQVKRGKFPLVFDELAVDCPAPAMTATVHPRDKDNWDVIFHIRPTDSLGSIGSPVTFHFLDHGKTLSPSVEQQSYVEIRGPVMASPPSLLLTLPPGQHIRQTISIVNRSGQGETPHITDALAGSGRAKATIVRQTSGDCILLDYTAPAHDAGDRGVVSIGAILDGHSYRLNVGYLTVVEGN